MTLKRFVAAVEIAAALGALVFVIMLFANEPSGGGGTASPGAGIFSANCATCHGANGEGAFGPQLAGKVVKAFPDQTDEIKLVTNGRASMPAWKGRLSAEQIRQVVEYTRTGLGK
jgi:mono/diheme cytochrome c family protein